MRGIDDKLGQSVKSAQLLLPENFHHRGMLEEGISSELDEKNIAFLSRAAKTMGIKYFYTMIKEDEKVVFVSSSATDAELIHPEKRTNYGDVYSSASKVLLDAFDSGLVAYEDSKDKWGHFHSVLVPMRGEDGMVYVAGADIEIDWLDHELHDILLHGLLDMFFSLLLLIPFVLVYAKQNKQNKRDMENAFLKHTKELKQLQYALDSHSIVAITNPKGTITCVNKMFEEVSGYARDEVIGQDHRIINSGNHDRNFWKEMYQTITKGRIWRGDVLNKAKDGTLYCLKTSIVPFLDDQGKHESYIAIRTDITDLKDYQELILKKEELVQTLLESVTEGIYGMDSLGICTFANKALLQILGYDREEEVVGKNVHELIHYARLDGTPYPSDECKIYKSSRNRASIDVDDEVYWKRDGTRVEVEYWSYPKLHNDEYDGAVVRFMDITQQNALKAEYHKQEQMLMQQSRLAQMGEMISMIAHQWRQPLGAISSTVVNLKFKIELESFDLQTPEGIDAMNRFFIENLNDIESYVGNLSSTIDDFRNFYSSDKKMASTSFRTVVERALKIVRTSMEINNIELIEDYEDESIFDMYDNEILQVVLNVLKNAQDNFKEKATNSPQIKIIAKKNALLICDNGGGIPKEILDKIFDPYFSTKNEKNGTGLGLYMSKTIIEEHHQGILAAHNQNGGVSFKIQLKDNHA